MVSAGTGASRIVDNASFANATRYHSGGIAGLRPGEVPAILKRGEEVLTENNPRHVANAGAGGGEDRFKIVNMFDTGDVLEHALGTRVGERAILNYVRSNASAINSALGSS
jgi:hypothetical protein